MGVKSGRGVTLAPHPLLVPWSRKSRGTPLLPLWAVRPLQSLSACIRVHFTWRSEMDAIGDSTLLYIVGDQPAINNCVKYHNIVSWTMSICNALQTFSSLLASQRLIMNKTVPTAPRDLLTTGPVFVRHYLSIVCVITSICNFIQIIPDCGCVHKPFSLSRSALNLADSNSALFETTLLLFPPVACHSEYPVLPLKGVHLFRYE